MPSDNEPGGDSIEVILKKNGKIVFYRAAWLNQLLGNGSVRRYRTDDGDLFNINESTATPKQIAQRLFNEKGKR